MKTALAMAMAFFFAALCCLLLPFLVAALFGWRLEIGSEDEVEAECQMGKGGE
jgi:hypothetical protein